MGSLSGQNLCAMVRHDRCSLKTPWTLISPGLDQFRREASRICKDHFVAAGHLNEPEEAKAARHARMPSPFGALRQSVILRAVQITLRNLCGVESLEV